MPVSCSEASKLLSGLTTETDMHLFKFIIPSGLNKNEWHLNLQIF